MGNTESDRRIATLDKYKTILKGPSGKEAKEWYYQDFKVYLENKLKRNGTPWKEQAFLNILNEENGNVPVDEKVKFCRWKEIQKEILDAVIQHHQYDYYYPWEKDAEPLLQKYVTNKDLMKTDCNEIDTVEKETKNSQKNKSNECSFNTIDLSSCLPERRNKLYIDGIKSNIEITENIINSSLSDTFVTEFFFGSVVGSLASKAKHIIKKLKDRGNTDAHICKIMKRNIADYKDLFLGKDIVPYYYSKLLQCKLEKIRNYINQKDETKYSQLLDTKIKNIVQKHLDGIMDEDGNQCEVYNTSNTVFQCLRFLEEWFEEFLKQKQNIQNNIIHRCVNKNTKLIQLRDGGKHEMTCSAYCKGYIDFLQNSKSCYETYLRKCTENISKSTNIDEGSARAEIDATLRKIFKKLKCPPSICGDDYNLDLFPYFNPSDANFSLHKGYHCGCQNSVSQKNNNNLKNILKRYSEKNDHTATISELETILKELSVCSINDDDLDGSVGGNGEKLLTKSRDGSGVKGICGVNYYDSFIGKNIRNPCGNNTIKGKGWICDGTRGHGGETLKAQWKNNACLPPRTQVLCLGFLCNEENKYHLDASRVIDSSQKLLTELVYAAIVEGQNLKKHFTSRDSRHRDNLCNALKYSFSDLGDMVRGRSIWENAYTQRMENNLRKIFHNIYDKLPSDKQNIYNDKNYPRQSRDLPHYHYLRETWWNTNREYIWKALLCGAQINVGGCGGNVPNIDYMPQFLRWLTEWSGNFCEEKNTYDIDTVTGRDSKNILSMCKGCNAEGGSVCDKSYPDSGYVASNETCSLCKTTCQKYKNWIRKEKREYDTQKKKYDDEIKKHKNLPTSGGVIRGPNISYNSKNVTESFFNKIENHYPHVNKFLDDRLEYTGCDKNVEKIDFIDEKNMFNSKHRYCRACNEQDFLNILTGGTMLADGMPGSRPGYSPSPTAPPKSDGGSVNKISTQPTLSGSQNTTIPRTPYVSTVQNECDVVLEKMSNYWDCNKNDSKRTNMCKLENGTISAMEDDDEDVEDGMYNDEFYRFFNKWVKLFLEEYKIFKDKMRECKTNLPVKKEMNCPNKDCKLRCYCYNKWIKKRKKEWEMQKQYYEEFNKEIYGNNNFSSLYRLGVYFYSQFKDRIHNVVGNEISRQELEQDSEDDPLKPILKKSQELIDDCMKLCPKKLQCSEKGFKNEWDCETADTTAGSSITGNSGDICLKKGDNKYGQANMDKVEDVYKFYDSFEEWIDYMEKSINDKMKILKQSCHTINTSRHGSASTMDCETCNDDCDCYKNWKEKIDNQWEKLKEYYNKHKNKSGNNMQGVELNYFLEALCETKYGDNSDQDGICTKLKGNEYNFVEGLLNKHKDKKKYVCEVCDTKNTKDSFDGSICDEIEQYTGTYSEKSFKDLTTDGTEITPWKCTENPKQNLENHVCVPPRGQKLYISNMVYGRGTIVSKKFSNPLDLKNKLKSAIKIETKELHKYYKKETGKDAATVEIPPGFCDAAYRSFNDFKNIVTGNSLWKPGTIGALEKKIVELIENKNANSGTTREQWWKSHEKDFWNAVKCGIQEAGGRGNECPKIQYDENYNSQFYWWFREWGDDFCKKKKEKAQKVKGNCSDTTKRNCDSANTNDMVAGECKTACEEYKNLIARHRNAWEKFSEHFNEEEEKKEKHNTSSYNNYTEYLLINCPECSGTNFEKVFNKSNDHGDYQNTCRCQQSGQPQKTHDIQPCDATITTSNCREKNNRNVWNTTMIKNPDKYKAYAPPRRQKLCLGNLYGLTGGENPKLELEKQLYAAAKKETEFLKKYYDEKKNGSTAGSSNNNNELCTAMKRSFYDFGDIIKGMDMSRGIYDYMVERELTKIFKYGDQAGSASTIQNSTDEKIKKEREKWWEEHKGKVWKAMTNCGKDNQCESNTPNDTTPQFLRWFTEWGEHICEERQNQLNELKKKCNDDNNSVDTDKNCDLGSEACKQQCNKYNRWITTHKYEWLGQKSKYEEIVSDKFDDKYEYYQPYIKDYADANTYITSKNDKCKNNGSASRSNINIDEVFNKTDDDYKKYEPFCTTCRINDIAERAKENTRVNPCGDKRGVKPTKNVKKVAEVMQGKAQETMKTNNVVGSNESKLKGDISKAQFKNIGSSLDNSKICNLNKETHTNDKRKYKAKPGINEHNGPCTGKGGNAKDRFKIGKEWESKSTEVKDGHQDVLLPPRRLDMCTSNLENLDVHNAEGLRNDNKAIHSLLGDVLLAAKYEGEFIKNNYNGQNNQNDKDGMCRAMKYSFADIGDIIRGRDLWNREYGNKNLQDHLQKIFEKIKGKDGDGKYTGTDGISNLRNDWWTANRDKIWKAMQCAKINDGTPPCRGSGTPLDDYIPQRLRWMTEWAEWFCKAQKELYDKVKGACDKCKSIEKGEKCAKCTECRAKCDEYSKIINKWKKQWTKMETKYQELYEEAQNRGTTTTSTDKDVVEFLSQLHEANKGKSTTYENAEGYVHEELKNMECHTQKYFCDKPTLGGKSNSDDKEYAFKDPPKDYVEACGCTDTATAQKSSPAKPVPSVIPSSVKPQGPPPQGRNKAQGTTHQSGQTTPGPDLGSFTNPGGGTAKTSVSFEPTPGSEPPPIHGNPSSTSATGNPPPGSPAVNGAGGGGSGTVAKTQKEPCKIVEEILLKPRDSITGGLYNCNHKTEPFYWDCDPGSMNNENKGACMPPRRQKLCIHNLTKLDPTKNTDELRRAFIKCAALETHFSWNKYKRGNIQAFSELQKGTIPDNFLRSMKYSFGDYRDIFFRTDITSHSYIAEVSQNVLNILKKEKDKQSVPKIQNDRELLNKWWETYHKDIWDAMVCSLTHGLTDDSTKTKIKTNYPYSDDIETFAKTPQFLRWFTEWGDEFCHERKTQLKLLHGNCSGYKCNQGRNEDKKTKCEGACEIYQTFIDKWKKEYETQSEKYKRDKYEEKYKSTSAQDDVEKANNAYQYLNTQFKELCKNGQCKCMEKPSKQSKTSQPNSSANDVMPKSLDYPPEEFKNSCDCKPPEEEEPDSSLNCVNKSAFDLKNVSQEGIKDVEKTLKGKNTKDIYESDNGTNDGSICKIKESNGQNDICKNNENPFDDIDKWECKKKDINVANQDICIPPRRKYMCTKPLENMKIISVNDTNELLKDVLITAANEGKHLKEQWEKTESTQKKADGTTNRPSIKRYELCDAMKYSFADLGDIIRGRDKYRGDNSKIENKLKTVFKNIQKEKNIEAKYTDTGDGNYTKLREAWWDANRKEIWKAMTCSAPDNFLILKRGKGSGSDIEILTSSEHIKCGHKHFPPNDDYIPQPFRWISEWSENYCISQNHKLSIFKDCNNCTTNNGKCEQKVRESCKKCKNQCEQYNKFVENWKKQYNIQNKAYEEIYTNATTSNGRNVKVIDENTKKFVEKLRDICNNPKTSGEYLDKGNYCKKFKFDEKTTNGKNYAFETPSNIYKENCDCANKFEEVDQCPVNKDECNKYGTYGCPRKNYNNIEWDILGLRYATGKNKGVLIPPRRKKICLGNINIGRYGFRVKDKLKKFKEDLLKGAAREAKSLSDIYSNDDDALLISLKYSFADIGNIVKGDDMVEDIRTRNVTDVFKKKINVNKEEREKINRIQWWEENKHKVWNVMMCHYNGAWKTQNECPKHDNIDEEDQFLRWFTEWGEIFCTRRNELYNNMVKKCQDAICDKSIGTVNVSECTDACAEYKNYILKKKIEYEIQKTKYDKGFKSSQGNRKAHNFLKHKCYEYNCECLSKNFSDNKNWNDPYDTFDDTSFKNKCDCKKTEEISIKTQKKKERKKKPKTKRPEDELAPVVQPDSKSIPVPTPLEPPQNNEPFNSDILSSTLPLGIGFSLASIALLFYMQKKPILRPTKLFRVIDIPQNDYGIPTNESSNRYVPYISHGYKGKTYIYVEGEETDDHVRDISSSDITSSSESEFEEMDVNDIYKPHSSKYKTLIEVVLKPSKTYGTQDAHTDHMEDISDTPIVHDNTKYTQSVTTSDTPTNKLTDDEWNQLKQDFISQYLENIQKDLYNENIMDDNMYKDTQPNILDYNNDEKPFITFIQDRDLNHCSEEVTYNINWNIPKNINGTTNIIDDPKYVLSSDKYSGIDLINDSLNRNHNVDIYDELLKRKENELYGINHPKNTTFNRVATQICGDPIGNQIDFFHKWLDRNRYMCEKWSNKEEMMNKLNEEWEKENNINYHIIYNTSNDIINNINNKSKLSNANVSMEINMDQFNVTNTDVLNANISLYGNY